MHELDLLDLRLCPPFGSENVGEQNECDQDSGQARAMIR
jgi:hypothetical protein